MWVKSGFRVGLSALLLVFGFMINACTSSGSKPVGEQMTASYVQPSAEEFDRYADKLIRNALKSNHIVGLSAVVFDGEKVLWHRDYGYRDKEQRLLVNGDSQYQIGSLTKLITAAAIMKLQEDNLLSIDDPVIRYVSDFAVGNCYDTHTVTIKDLLIHESGLENSYWPGFWTQNAWRKVYQQLDCSMVSFAPHTIQHYSNIASDLLGNIIEQVSGKSNEDYVRNAIFYPLQMSHADFESFDNRNADLAHLSKSFDEKGKTVPPSFVRDTPAGGVVASVTELARFAQVFLPGSQYTRVFSDAETVRQMLSPQGSDGNMAMDAQMGLGWFLKTSPLSNEAYVIEHSGSTIYHHSQIIMYPERNIGIIVMANSGVRFSLGDLTGSLFNRATGIPDEKWFAGTEPHADQPNSPLQPPAL